MKKAIAIIVFGLLWCNTSFAGVADDALTNIKKIKDLLKGNYQCQNIINQNEWTFSFSKISNKNYYVEASNNSIGKLFAELKTYKDLWWYQIIEPEGDGSLIINALELSPKREVNYMSILVFFVADYTKKIVIIKELLTYNKIYLQIYLNEWING